MSKQRRFGRRIVEKQQYGRPIHRLEVGNKTCISQCNLYSIMMLLGVPDAAQYMSLITSKTFTFLFKIHCIEIIKLFWAVPGIK